MTTEKAIIVRDTGEIIESRPLPVKLTEEAIAITVSNIQMAEKLVFKVLEKDVDYGRIPGLPGESLFDPGAQKIANAFNTYPKHNVLFREETEQLISYTIETQLISRDTQQVVGSGIGASSTMEPKNKYRWVRDPQEFGYSEEEIATLKTKTEERRGEEYDLYRILNPEYGELVNTIAQISAKRSEVDASKSLPGVGSALKKLFTGKQRPELDWNSFWANTKNMNLNSDQVHAILNVKSMKEWATAGKSLNDAIKKITEHLAKGKTEDKSASTPAVNSEEASHFTLGEDTMGEATLSGKAATASARDMDRKMLRSSASKLKWDQKRLTQELKSRVGTDDLSKLTDEQLHDIASKLTDLAELA